jgi:phosphatidate cytidylyltransferase
MNNLKLRFLSGIIIGVIFLTGILLYPLLFQCLMIIVGVGMIIEWVSITRASIIHILLGFIIIPIPIIALLIIANEKMNKWMLLAYFVTIWSVDTFAMFGGKTFKGPKLAKYISPNKTWSGLIIGILGAGLMMNFLTLIPNFQVNVNYLSSKINLIIGSMLLAGLAQASDLYVSYFKRKFNVKDSGSFIPGHGGLLDRFDSIILTAPLLLIIIYIV